MSPTRAIALQREFAHQVITTGRIGRLRLAAGADLAFTKDKAHCIAGVVVWDVAAQTVVEQHVVRRPIRFPYVPGLLSFREAPAIIAAIRRLKCKPDVFLFDGQGFAHPRRFGLACHVGIFIDRPSIGCAKSILVGRCDEPGARRGDTTRLVHNGERIGLALRTRDRVKPIYVSVGHLVSLEFAASVVLSCCTKYRLPVPTRLADQLVARAKEQDSGISLE